MNSPYATSTVASPNFDDNSQVQDNDQTDKLTYVPTVHIMNWCIHHSFTEMNKKIICIHK